jgi:hypothetical protein
MASQLLKFNCLSLKIFFYVLFLYQLVTNNATTTNYDELVKSLNKRQSRDVTI